MNTVTLTLPDTLYRQLQGLAQTEGLSLSQYLLNAMFAYAMSNYRVRATSDTERLQQRADFLALLDRLGTASDDEIDRVLAERERVAPEPELSVETAAKMRALIEARKAKHTG
ncbi:MAG: toxin-antitoxin system HicB family antitoxin [Acidobacteria bacterium]|nr:toxin-antitoxin system HicB family antitoxin [Acidobacteriota bacterium]MBI3425940.1 toxin-antitoxin system HicB family antitoxin [Acidobacteriota bacterium]